MLDISFKILLFMLVQIIGWWLADVGRETYKRWKEVKNGSGSTLDSESD